MSFEKTGLAILKTLGFEKFRRPRHQSDYMHYDYDVEKDDVKYSIEIKNTAKKMGRYTIPVDELRDMVSQLKDERRKPLLLLMDESQYESAIVDYYLFELKSTSFGSFELVNSLDRGFNENLESYKFSLKKTAL